MVKDGEVTGVIDWPGAAFADPELDVATSLVLIKAGEDPHPPLQRMIFPHAGAAARYCIAQRFLPAIAQGETRTLVAAGQIVGSYLRVPADGLRANLDADATVSQATLTAAQTSLVSKLATEGLVRDACA